MRKRRELILDLDDAIDKVVLTKRPMRMVVHTNRPLSPDEELAILLVRFKVSPDKIIDKNVRKNKRS